MGDKKDHLWECSSYMYALSAWSIMIIVTSLMLIPQLICALKFWTSLSSLARCLHALGKSHVCNFKKLFDDPPLNDYFEILLWANLSEQLFYYSIEIYFLPSMSIRRPPGAFCWTQMLIIVSSVTNYMDSSWDLLMETTTSYFSMCFQFGLQMPFFNSTSN